jgi:hypothetical protein
MTTTTDTQTTTTTETATVPVRGTWKQHGNPTALEFFGTAVKAPADKGVVVHKIVTDPQGITLKARNGRTVEGGAFGVATKFWAIVPAEAIPAKPAKGDKAAPAAPVEITAPKGGDQTVAPIKGAVAKAIAATGKSIMAISRDNGLNPSQMRRLSLDTVAKVDLPRAEAIAKALGVKVTDLFGAPVAKAAVKAPAGTETGTTPARPGRKGKSRTDRAAELAEQDGAKAAEGDQAAKAEADEAAKAAEGTQETPEA